MGFFKKIFGEKEKEKEVIDNQDQEIKQSPAINPQAPMIQNQILCNACGQEIEGTPRFINFNGRKMVFHKKCFKKLKSGNIQL